MQPFVTSFVHLEILLFDRVCGLYIYPSIVHSFALSCMHQSIHTIMRSSICSFIHTIMHSSDWWFVDSCNELIPRGLTLGEGFPGIQFQSFQVQLAGFVSVAISHLQGGPGMPAGH